MAIYRDTGVFCLSITGTEKLQYRPLLDVTAINLLMNSLGLACKWSIEIAIYISYQSYIAMYS